MFIKTSESHGNINNSKSVRHQNIITNTKIPIKPNMNMNQSYSFIRHNASYAARHLFHLPRATPLPCYQGCHCKIPLDQISKLSHFPIDCLCSSSLILMFVWIEIKLRKEKWNKKEVSLFRSEEWERRGKGCYVEWEGGTISINSIHQI